MGTFKGTHWSKMPNAEEIRQRISDTKKAEPTRYWLGKTHSEKTKKKISEKKTGRKLMPEHIEKIRNALTGRKGSPRPDMQGPNNPNWKGGITEKNSLIRNSYEYVEWRNAVYARDNYCCQMCGDKCEKGNIVAHHVESFFDHPTQRFEVLNGATLHRSCHLAHHKKERKLATQNLITWTTHT